MTTEGPIRFGHPGALIGATHFIFEGDIRSGPQVARDSRKAKMQGGAGARERMKSMRLAREIFDLSVKKKGRP